MQRNEPGSRQVEFYNSLMQRARARLDAQASMGEPSLERAVDEAVSAAVAAGELSREQGERIGAWLARDLADAGHYLADTGEGDLAAWLRFDLDLIEERLLELFSRAADQTKLALLALAERARQATPYHTGEITGPGSLECAACGHLLQFRQAAHIPPCAKCHGTEFRRPTR